MNYESTDELDFGVGTAALDPNVIAGENHVIETLDIVTDKYG